MDNCCRVSIYDTSVLDIQNKKCLFKDKEVAEAYAVLPKLIRLIDEYNEGWKPNWGDKNDKYYIGLCDNRWDLDSIVSAHYPLVFKTAGIRDKFFNDHEDLLEIVRPLL